MIFPEDYLFFLIYLFFDVTDSNSSGCALRFQSVPYGLIHVIHV